MPDYACLQILDGAPRERMIDAVSSYMDARGLRSCGREEAARTVCLVPASRSWAVYDDAADRQDAAALHGLGRALTGTLHTDGVGVMCAGQGLLLSLYTDGRLRDIYTTSRPLFDGHGHPIRWRGLLEKEYPLSRLSDLFARGRREGRRVFPELRQAFHLDETADFGFSSLEYAAPPGLITLYFCPTNVVKQSLWDRLWHPARRTAAGLGMLFHRPRPRNPES